MASNSLWNGYAGTISIEDLDRLLPLISRHRIVPRDAPLETEHSIMADATASPTISSASSPASSTLAWFPSDFASAPTLDERSMTKLLDELGALYCGHCGKVSRRRRRPTTVREQSRELLRRGRPEELREHHRARGAATRSGLTLIHLARIRFEDLTNGAIESKS
jgi:hypothetical protein